MSTGPRILIGAPRVESFPVLLGTRSHNYLITWGLLHDLASLILHLRRRYKKVILRDRLLILLGRKQTLLTCLIIEYLLLT